MNSVGGDAGDVLLAAARVLPIRGNERGMVPSTLVGIPCRVELPAGGSVCEIRCMKR
jgi:hypothetical protein